MPMILVLFLFACLTFVSSAGAAKIRLVVEEFGSAEQPTFVAPGALAVDPDSGDLLVAEAGSNVIARYHADGTASEFAALGTNVIDGKGGSDECPADPAACDRTPQGQLTLGNYPGEIQIAIDDSGGSTDGNIYVNQLFPAAGNVVDVFASSGKYLGQITAADGVKFGSGESKIAPTGVAVDGSGSIYLSDTKEDKIHKYVPSGSTPTDADYVTTFSTVAGPRDLVAGAGPSAGVLFVTRTTDNLADHRTVAIDSTSGAVKYYLNEDHGPPFADAHLAAALDPLTGRFLGMNRGYVVEYSVSGAGVSPFATYYTGDGAGIAVDGANDRVYVSYVSGAVRVSVYGPLVAIPDVTTDPATVTGDTSVSLKGTVNPDGTPLEECFFKYGLTGAYGQTVPCAETPAEIGTSQKAVHADVGGLQPETLYHYRLVAKNENGTVGGEDETVKTPSKPSVEAWSVDVGFAEATLKAAVNPESSPTTYRLEWGTDATYGQGTAEIPVGSDNVPHEFSHPLEGLEPGLAYHYRVVATNSIGVTATPDLTFHTYPEPFAPKSACPNQAFRSGASSRLPDCRAFEMVTPVEKGNTDVSVRVSAQNYQARLDLSSSDGNAFSFSSEKSFGDAVGAPYSSQYLMRREPGKGWLTTAISPSRGAKSVSDLVNIKYDVEYKSFSGDLSSGWLYHNTAKTHDGCAVPGYSNLYRRDNATGAYEALTTAEPEGQTPANYWPELQGASADGTHAIFRANARLTDSASDAKLGEDPIYQLYEHVAPAEGEEGCGELRLVSVLPSGKASALTSSAGTASNFGGEGRQHNVLGAVSEDGSRIYWTSADPDPSVQANSGPGPLYLRSDGTKTVQVSSGPAQFWTASPDGSKAIYSVGENLFEYDAVAKKSNLIADGSRGIAGASEDLSKVYFVSKEELGGKGEAGEANLYLRAEGADTFIATLTVGDPSNEFSFNGFKAITARPVERGTRVSSDGNTLAFVSRASLTGYDNKDAADGRNVLEIYLYDATAGQLFCASCNPSGSRPRGREFEDNGATLLAAAQLPPAENSLFAPRALSEDGSHLFFESFEALVPRDTNGAADVYEWQRAGAEEACREAGAELFVPQAGGCLSLISSGQSPSDSEMIDATPSGSDVFFKTASSLLPQDPGLIDVYDARVNGGLPQPPGPPAGCEGEACQGPLSPPDDPTPASGSGEYAGNVAPEKPRCPKGKGKGKACKPCPKGKVRRHGRCVKKHNKPHKKAKNQAGQERRAGR
jgi:hypothetical protein